jgi:putative acetyltransferase
MITIRPQNSSSDPQAIAAINAGAFAEHGGTEAFDKFRTERDDIVSLVAEENGVLLGHVLFSPVTLAAPAGKVTGMGLGQLAVTPERQKEGIGSQLSETGIQQLREIHCPFVIVIGHAAYYPRFGFERGSLHNVKCQWPHIPDETFMVLFLDEQTKDQLTGVASFDGL